MVLEVHTHIDLKQNQPVIDWPGYNSDLPSHLACFKCLFLQLLHVYMSLIWKFNLIMVEGNAM